MFLLQTFSGTVSRSGRRSWKAPYLAALRPGCLSQCFWSLPCPFGVFSWGKVAAPFKTVKGQSPSLSLSLSGFLSCPVPQRMGAVREHPPSVHFLPGAWVHSFALSLDSSLLAHSRASPHTLPGRVQLFPLRKPRVPLSPLCVPLSSPLLPTPQPSNVSRKSWPRRGHPPEDTSYLAWAPGASLFRKFRPQAI